MSSESQAFNDGFDKGFNKALDKITKLEAKNEARLRHWVAEYVFTDESGTHILNGGIDALLKGGDDV